MAFLSFSFVQNAIFASTGDPVMESMLCRLHSDNPYFTVYVQEHQ